MNPALIAGEIVDPMRDDHARGEAGEIMIKRFERLLAVHFAIAVECSQELFLLGIDAQDWVASSKKLLDHLSQMAELGAAMRRVAAGQNQAHRESVARCGVRHRRIAPEGFWQSLGGSNPSTQRSGAWDHLRCGS